MSDELDIKLGSRDGHAQFRHAFAKLIRAEAFEEAENFLGEQAISIQTEIGDICRNLAVYNSPSAHRDIKASIKVK